MLAYRYDEETMHYVEPQECQKDPLESIAEGRDVWLLPASCTFVAPLDPREGHYVVWNGTAWEYEPIPTPPEPAPPTLEEAKERKIDELKNERDTREMLPIAYNGHNFDFDQKSYERITAAIYALDISGGVIAWTTADNSTVSVSANDLRSVIAQAALRSNELHIKYRTLKERVNAAQTVADVEAIVWEEYL